MYSGAQGRTAVEATIVLDDGLDTDERPRSYAIGELPLVSPLREQSAGYYRAKRVIDIVVASLALVVLSPLLLLIAVATMIDSGRPIVYSQQRVRSRRIRVGDEWVWRLEPFTFYKFRTMYVGAGASPHEEYMAAYINGDEEALVDLGGHTAAETGTYKLLDDPRVTRVGHLLRSLSLDELPQLYNVIIGDMTLVGPRPPIPYEVAMYRPRDMDRMAAPPGLTGAWQVGGRCDLSFEESIQLDTDYIRQQSIGEDLKILLKTIPAVLTGKGAG